MWNPTVVANKARFPGVLWRQCELRWNSNTTCYVKSVKKTPLHTYVLKIHVCHVQPFHKKVTESKKGKWGHYFTDLIGRLTWLNTFTVFIYFKYIYCFKLCNNYQKSFNPSTIHPLATISKAISNQHRRVKWEKRGLFLLFLFFCFTDRLLRLRISTVTVKITLGEGPCTTASEQHRENGSVPLSYFWNWRILTPCRKLYTLTGREAEKAQVATTQFEACMRTEKLTACRTAENQPHAHKVVPPAVLGLRSCSPNALRATAWRPSLSLRQLKTFQVLTPFLWALKTIETAGWLPLKGLGFHFTFMMQISLFSHTRQKEKSGEQAKRGGTG